MCVLIEISYVCRFPQDSDLKKKWLAAVCRPNVSRTGVICSEHFATDNFLRSNRSQLIGKAFPTLKIPIVIITIFNLLVCIKWIEG